VIEIDGLTLRYGGVTPLDSVTIQFPMGTNGLIGPNGAGKTSFFNVMSGFARPQEGTITAFGEDLLAMPHFRRARWGLRRTFQTEQAIQELSIYENVALIHEHAKADTTGTSRREDILGAIEFVGIKSDPYAKVASLSAHERRLVELARAVVGKPRVVLLDEPAAGLPDDETVQMGEVIKRIPEHMDALVILVDHDMTLVQNTCTKVAVLDFGKLIADGPTAEVLRDEQVMRAYLGTAEVKA
jgi:branched-chain amino acid transport system ATP-binding protein